MLDTLHDSKFDVSFKQVREKILESFLLVMKEFWERNTAHPEAIHGSILDYERRVRNSIEGLCSPSIGNLLGFESAHVCFSERQRSSYASQFKALFGLIDNGPWISLKNPSLWGTILDAKPENWGVGKRGNNTPSVNELLKYFRAGVKDVSGYLFYRMAVFDPQYGRVGSKLEDVVHLLEHPSMHFEGDEKAFWIDRFISELFEKDAVRDAFLAYMVFGVFKGIRKPYKVLVYSSNSKTAYDRLGLTTDEYERQIEEYASDFVHWQGIGAEYSNALLATYNLYGRPDFRESVLGVFKQPRLEITSPDNQFSCLWKIRNFFVRYSSDSNNPSILLRRSLDRQY